MRLLSASIMLVALAGFALPAFADSIDWQACYNQPHHHCMLYSAEESTAPQSANPNELVTIILPQNGAPVIQGILSHDNFTALENNVAVMRVSFSGTNTLPTMNYCPQAMIIIQNQGVPSYLNKFYNSSVVPPLNLTHFIYPDYCYTETGPNPIDHSYKITPVPEFGATGGIILAISILSIVIFSRSRKW